MTNPTPFTFPKSLRCFVLFVSSLLSPAQVKAIKETRQPARIRETLWVLPSGWTGKIPPQGSVSTPGELSTLAPGQKVAFAAIADGDGRDELLQGRTLTIRITTSQGIFSREGLKPVAIRKIKAEGADLAMRLLDASGVASKDRSALEEKLSMVSLAIFEPGWESPAVSKEEKVLIQAILGTDAASALPLKPSGIALRPWNAWMSGPEPTEASCDEFMKSFHAVPQPGMLLPMLKFAAHSRGLESHSVYSFFAAAFQAYPAARTAALASMPSLDPLTKWALLTVLRLGGQEVSEFIGDLPEDAKVSLKGMVPMTDPRHFQKFQDPVIPESVGGIGVPMDQCWGAWMATGDSSYLKALVGLLDGAPDYPAYEAFLKTKPGLPGLNARVANGMAYQIAGWSIGSFQRSDPAVSDWLAYWQKDPSTSKIIQEQISSLPGNPAFNPPKQQ